MYEDEIKLVEKGYNLLIKTVNHYHVQFRDPELFGYIFNWYHTTGTLTESGPKNKSHGKIEDVEDICILIKDRKYAILK